MNRQKILTINEIDKLKKQPIKSFVRNHGRLTAGQQKALVNFWDIYGIDYQEKELDLSQFGSFSKVVLEIGFGNGEAFITMAKKFPNTLFIGAEVHKPGIGRALLLANKYNVKNIRIVAHDAIGFIDNMLTNNSIDRVQIFFPDPWPKKRHFKRRLIQKEFCQKLQRIIKDDGILHIATDWQPYAEHCLDIISMIDFFENVSSSKDYIKKPDYRPQTKFEQRGIKLGHKIIDMCFRLRKKS